MTNPTQSDAPGEADLAHRVSALLALVTPDQRPNVNALWTLAKEIPLISLNIKFFGYELARKLVAALPVRDNLFPHQVGLRSKPSTQVDLEQDWVAYWASQAGIPVIFHRKIWELTYVMQAMYEHGVMRQGASGVGFGCGREPIPSLLAARGINVIVTDLDPVSAAGAGWARANQNTDGLETAFKPDLVSHEAFLNHVSLRRVDMNAIPADLRNFDFCWSICALEHIGSISKGLDFIENSLETLRPGGLAVHTTEFNFLDDQRTIDNWGTVLFQRHHFRELYDRLSAKGHVMQPLDFDVGSRPMDKFIDLPPFIHDWPPDMRKQWGMGVQHIKVSSNGFAATCFGIIIRKAT